MPFQKGQSGNPTGRSKGEAILSDALRVALNRTEKRQTKTNAARIAAKLIRLAIGGDVQAAKLIIERLEGKPHASLAIKPEAPMVYQIVTGVPRTKEDCDLLVNENEPDAEPEKGVGRSDLPAITINAEQGTSE